MGENLLWFLLRNRRCRDTVTGDLLEEYQEAVLPVRGRLREYLGICNNLQRMLSFVTSATPWGSCWARCSACGISCATDYFLSW